MTLTHNIAEIIKKFYTPHRKIKTFHTIMLLKIEETNSSKN